MEHCWTNKKIRAQVQTRHYCVSFDCLRYDVMQEPWGQLTHGMIDLIQLFDVNTRGWVRLLLKHFKNLADEDDHINRVLFK